MKVLDLFSGIGGFSLGLERAGMRTVAFCEIDPFCRRVLAKHWPGVPIHDDIRTLSGAALTTNGIAADVVCGGVPCQDISLAGRGAGLSGDRSGLWFEMLRLIGETSPRWVIIENSPALRSRGLDVILGGLDALRFNAEWHCIPAAALGAPHRRDRLWIIAHAARVGCGQGRPWRFADGLAWLSDAPRWNPANTHGARLAQRQGEQGDACTEQPPAQRISFGDVWQSKWPDEPALSGMDDGPPHWMDRVRATGNAVIPQIPELIGRRIAEVDALQTKVAV